MSRTDTDNVGGATGEAGGVGGASASGRRRARVWLALAALLAVGLGIRLAMLAANAREGLIESDEAIVGLMARHMLEGEWSWFYWGQSYMGSLEAMVAALLFSVAGATPFVLKCVPLLFYAATMIVLFVVLERRLGLAGAVLGTLFFALSSQFFVIWSMKARGGFIESVFFGTVLLAALDALAHSRNASRGWRVGLHVGTGLLAGVGMWTSQLVGLYLVPGVLVLLLRWRSWLTWMVILLAAAFFVGYLPQVLGQWQGDEWRYSLSECTLAPAAVASKLEEIGVRGMPIILGAVKNCSDMFIRPLLSPYALLFWGVLGIAFVVDRLRLAGRSKRGDDLFLMVALVLVLAPVIHAIHPVPLYSVGSYVIEEEGRRPVEPRCLLCLCGCLPILVGYWYRRFGQMAFLRRGLMAALVPVAVLYGISYLKTNHADYMSTPGYYTGPLTEAISRCRKLSIDQVSCSYWLAYRFAFDAEEHPIVYVGEGWDRYPPYQEAWPGARRKAWLAWGKEKAMLAAAFRRRGIAVKAEDLGELRLFVPEDQ